MNRRGTETASKKHRSEEVVAKLRQVDALVLESETVAEAIRAIQVTVVPAGRVLDGEIFYTLREAEVIIESWRRHYNSMRPRASLGFRRPRRRCSRRLSPSGQRRYAGRPRRPHRSWRPGQR